MIKAVIFDYGGVVKSSSGDDAVKDIAVAYGVSRKIIIKKIRPIIRLFQKGLITENRFWKKSSSSLRRPIPKNKKDLWRKIYEKTFRIYPEIISFIKKIKTQSIKTAVLSNTIKPHVEIIVKHNGYKNFDVVILSCRVHLQKPDPKIYLLTAKRLGIKPKECIFIDDEEKNLKSAKKLGMKTVLAKNTKQVINSVSRILDSPNRF